MNKEQKKYFKMGYKEGREDEAMDQREKLIAVGFEFRSGNLIILDSEDKE